jgi:hypothetical protein
MDGVRNSQVIKGEGREEVEFEANRTAAAKRMCWMAEGGRDACVRL